MIKNEQERVRIGQRIADLRKTTEWTDAAGIRRTGMTQAELAERTGLQRSHIARLEKGMYGATIERHTPEKREAKESNVINELKR